MTKQEYIILYQKLLQGKCTPEEIESLNAYEDDFELIESTKPGGKQAERIFLQIMETAGEHKRVKPFTLWKKIAAAAAILVFIVSAVFYFNNSHKREKNVVVLNHAKTIKPGSDKAILTLGNGQQIVLNTAAQGQIALESGTTINKTADGTLAYDVISAASEEVVLNTVSIPRGGQYSLVLPDGSKVWLNAASSIRFPTRFTGNSREVELDGEAYFEVAKNKQMPFYVKAQDMKLKVLGTHFNIMAYKDEAFIKTTLLEGKVMLTSASAVTYLKPGEEGVLYENKFTVNKADIEQTMAWKNGYFLFNEENLSSVMRKISRWYDIDIVYNTHNNKLSYTGSVSKFKDISEVLKVLSLTGTVKFNIAERRVTVIN
ncbi:FecR domain-containing protein [Pedobacter sp. ISL-68]|uniref:FecR family protein n=1 Tax=unclassified Pedobacter TaxID=2628915 RepID=UPI001BE8FBF0|nr:MULTISPECIES: FecR family protein [unclassified Pedobacter]MBT2561033.1 FecR domain-containing protein [Pedobacter sp. ISL-64]MBT2590422.1 FecR domain-containing protein [Pedobacter sp. ISL-68]